MTESPRDPALDALIRWFAAQADHYQERMTTDVTRLRADPCYGLKVFLSGYAYERNNAPGGYKPSALKAVAACWPRVEEIPRQYESFFRGKVNQKSNPALDSRLGQLEIPALVAWVEQGRLADAYGALVAIRGIGPKIAAFFVRDLVVLTGAQTAVPDLAGYVYAQPIDFWIRTTVSELRLPLPPRNPPAPPQLSHEDFDLAVRVCHAALSGGVCPLRLNQGMWYVCSQIIGDKGHLIELLGMRDFRVFDRELGLMLGFL